MWNVIQSGAFATILAVASPLASAEPDGRMCPDTQIQVRTDNADLIALICETVRDASAVLAQCGLEQRRPINLHLTDDLMHANGECLAAFDCTSDSINIVRPAKLPGFILDDSSYRLLPSQIIFRALLAHELAHAYLHQAAPEGGFAPVDQEYVAGAMELASLAPEHRTLLVEANPVTPPVEDDAINIMIYLFSPRKFAVRSWTHFQRHGCDRIREIVSGKFTFWRTPY